MQFAQPGAAGIQRMLFIKQLAALCGRLHIPVLLVVPGLVVPGLVVPYHCYLFWGKGWPYCVSRSPAFTYLRVLMLSPSPRFPRPEADKAGS